jgi:hypothetical protein
MRVDNLNRKINYKYPVPGTIASEELTPINESVQKFLYGKYYRTDLLPLSGIRRHRRFDPHL